jgi:hypothetical protein
MTFQTLYGGELFCMPDTFGERHALQAWGTCNTSTQQYSIGQPKTVPQVHQRSAAPLWRAPLLQLVRCSARDGRPVLHAGGAEADQQRAEECDERQRVGLQPAAPGSSCPFARGAPDRQTVLSSDLGLARLNRHSSASLARPRCNAQCCSRPMMRSVPSWRGGCCRWTGPLSACLVTTLVVSRGCGAGGSAPTLIPGGTAVRGGEDGAMGYFAPGHVEKAAATGAACDSTSYWCLKWGMARKARKPTSLLKSLRLQFIFLFLPQRKDGQPDLPVDGASSIHTRPHASVRPW